MSKPPYVSFDEIEIGENISDQKKNRISEVSDEFALSIDQGLITPLAVREGGPARTTGRRKAVLVAGFRRYGAIARLREGNVPGQITTVASWNQIPVRWLKGSAGELDTTNLVENLHRKNLDPFEEADAMQAYMDKHKVNQSALARAIAKSDPYVSQRLALRKGASDELRAAYHDGVITSTQVREIAVLAKDKQGEVVALLRAQASKGERMSTDEVRDEVIAKGPKARRKTGRKAASFDAEKIEVAKEYTTTEHKDKKLAPRPRQALVECLGTLVIRDRRNTTEKTTYYIQAIEFVLGLRDQL